jgi:hypothetical protein
MATPTEDGSAFILNGEKAIHNERGDCTGADRDGLHAADAGEPEPDEDCAFLVTPDMPGFEITEARMEKCGNSWHGHRTNALYQYACRRKTFWASSARD